jgi:hypothetical protein
VISLPASELLWRIVGTAVGLALAVATAIWEAVLTPMLVTSGGHVFRLPVAPLVAILANIAIVGFTLTVTKNIWLAMVPAIGWIAVMFMAGDLTSDGDLIIQGNWIGLTTIFLGVGAWAVGIYLWTTERGRRWWEPRSGAEPEPAVAAAPIKRASAPSQVASTPKRPGPARTRPKKSRSR